MMVPLWCTVYVFSGRIGQSNNWNDHLSILNINKSLQKPAEKEWQHYELVKNFTALAFFGMCCRSEMQKWIDIKFKKGEEKNMTYLGFILLAEKEKSKFISQNSNIKLVQIYSHLDSLLQVAERQMQEKEKYERENRHTLAVLACTVHILCPCLPAYMMVMNLPLC